MQENPKSHETQKSKYRVIFMPLGKFSQKDLMHSLIKGQYPYTHM